MDGYWRPASRCSGSVYLGGWFSPQKLSPARFVDEFERVNGIHSGFRRNHAKGVCVRGFFDSNGQGVHLSKAVVFQSGRVPVIGRFSLGGGDPHATDDLSTVRGLGLQFSLPDGEQWRTAMINLPVFPFKDPQAFYDNLVASQRDPNTHRPDPAKGTEFLASHPETERALAIIKSHAPSSGFDNAAYYGLNAFRFVNADGASAYVRWTLAPVQPYEAATGASQEKDFLFAGLIVSIELHPLQWHLVLTVAQPGDPTDNATIQWFDKVKNSVQATGAAGDLERRSRPEAKGGNPGDVRKVETLKGQIVGYVEEGAGQAWNCRTRIYHPLIGHVEQILSLPENTGENVLVPRSGQAPPVPSRVTWALPPPGLLLLGMESLS
jgi:catalase